MSQLPAAESEKHRQKKFKLYPIGYIPIDIAEVKTKEGKLYLIVAIDRVSKCAYAELHPQMTKALAAPFLRN